MGPYISSILSMGLETVFCIRFKYFMVSTDTVLGTYPHFLC